MKLTRAGAVYISITLLLGFAAVNTGNNLIYLVVSALLGFMAISGILGKWNLSRLRISCTPPDEVYDGLATLFSVTLENRRRWLPVFLIEITLGDQTALFPIVDPGTTKSKVLEATVHGRGVRHLEPVKVHSRFPINFFIRTITIPVEHPVTVFPKPLPLMKPPLPDAEGTRGEQLLWMRGQEGDISQIRDYRGSDPRKLIHWKLSARHDRLKVKELSATSHAPVTIDLDAIQGPDLEKRLCHGSHLILRLLRSGRPVGLKAGPVRIPPGNSRQHRLTLLKALALYGTD